MTEAWMRPEEPGATTPKEDCAQLRLRNRRVEVGELLAKSVGLLELLESRIKAGDRELAVVLQYVKTTQGALQLEHATLTHVLSAVSDEVSTLKMILDDFRGDIEGLKLLTSPEHQHGLAEHATVLESIFGMNGTSLLARLGAICLEKSMTLSAKHLTAVEHAIERMGDQLRHSKNDLKPIWTHAVHRLEQFADNIEIEIESSGE